MAYFALSLRAACTLFTSSSILSTTVFLPRWKAMQAMSKVNTVLMIGPYMRQRMRADLRREAARVANSCVSYFLVMCSLIVIVCIIVRFSFYCSYFLFVSFKQILSHKYGSSDHSFSLLFSILNRSTYTRSKKASLPLDIIFTKQLVSSTEMRSSILGFRLRLREVKFP